MVHHIYRAKKWSLIGLFMALSMLTATSTSANQAAGYRMAHMPQQQPIKRTFKKVDSYRWALKHPVNYWWDNNPSNYGNWDYFTPVDHPFEAVPLLIKQPAYVETTGQKREGFTLFGLF
ncbi:MAG: hypothetical protein HQL54_00120 [Magnetococcales bacterium]|nr:hypothetical protein [Magnetococcales bacterium]